MLAPLTPAAATALLSPSARVLAASAAPDAGVGVAASLPWSDVHWPTLLSLTAFERAESQLFTLLRAAPVGAVPDDVQRALQGIYRVAVFRSAELAEAAGVAADALRHAGVEALWLKGAALAMQSRADFAVRSMGDVDLLLQPGQHDVARQALRAVGWTDGGASPSYAGHHHDAPMLWRGGIRIELHSGLFAPGHPFATDPAGTWFDRSREVQWGERTVRVLPPAWHLVHAATHWAWSHEGEVGSWQYLHDAHRLSSAWRSEGTGWDAVVAHAQTLGASAPVGWALWAASRLGGVPVPDSTIGELRGRPRRWEGVAERAWVLRAFHSPMASPSVAWSRFWWRRAMRGLGDERAAWPWALGRAASSDAVPDAVPFDGSTGGSGSSGRLRRWRRHLARVVRG